MKDSNVLETAGTRVPLKQTPAAVLFIRCVGFSREIEGGSRTAMVRAFCDVHSSLGFHPHRTSLLMISRIIHMVVVVDSEHTIS